MLRRVQLFKYQSVMLLIKIFNEVKEKIQASNKCYFELTSLVRFRILSEN